MTDRASLTNERPDHRWNDPDGDGHDCIDCPTDSIWKCDFGAHLRSASDVLTPEEQKKLHADLTEMARQRRRATDAALHWPMA